MRVLTVMTGMSSTGQQDIAAVLKRLDLKEPKASKEAMGAADGKTVGRANLEMVQLDAKELHGLGWVEPGKSNQKNNSLRRRKKSSSQGGGIRIKERRKSSNIEPRLHVEMKAGKYS